MDTMHVPDGTFLYPFRVVLTWSRHHSFFAATEIKAMLAHILINYDMKAETDIRPKEICIAELATPNPQGKIWIRKRGSHGSGE